MLFHFSQLLHPNHFILVDLMHNLVHLYAARKILTRPEKERKIQLCTMVLETLVKIDPGFTKWRGTLLQVIAICSPNFIQEGKARDQKMFF